MFTEHIEEDVYQNDSISYDLIFKSKKGDQDSINQLIKSYKNKIFNYCYRILDNKCEAEDVMLETMIKAIKSISDLRDNTKFESWILKIARNKCLDELKKRNKRKYCLIDNLAIIDNKFNPEYQLIREEKEKNLKNIKEIIKKKINNLKPEYKEIFILIHYLKMSYKEASEVLDINENTAKTRMSRAINLLKIELKPYKDIYNEM